jgi:hypothetical protein
MTLVKLVAMMVVVRLTVLMRRRAKAVRQRKPALQPVS